MNATLTELKLDQEQSQDQDQDQDPDVLHPVEPPQLHDTSALWKAIERLDAMVVNNTVTVSRTSSYFLFDISMINKSSDLSRHLSGWQPDRGPRGLFRGRPAAPAGLQAPGEADQPDGTH